MTQRWASARTYSLIFSSSMTLCVCVCACVSSKPLLSWFFCVICIVFRSDERRKFASYFFLPNSTHRRLDNKLYYAMNEDGRNGKKDQVRMRKRHWSRKVLVMCVWYYWVVMKKCRKEPLKIRQYVEIKKRGTREFWNDSMVNLTHSLFRKKQPKHLHTWKQTNFGIKKQKVETSESMEEGKRCRKLFGRQRFYFESGQFKLKTTTCK